MFDSFYQFKGLGNSADVTNRHLQKKYQFYFDTEENNRYIICVEEYPNNIYVIKFFPRKHKNSKYKFNILTKSGRFTKIVRTNVEVLIKFYQKNPNSHFGFIGARKYCPIKKKYKEKLGDCSARFRSYKYVVENLIGPDTFVHHFDKSNNTYLLINSNVSDLDGVKSKASEIFEDCMN